MVRPLTPLDVERASERDAKHYELIRGELRHKAIGTRSMFIAGLICARLNQWLYPHTGAAVIAASIYCFGRPDHGRRPDVVYVARERLPGCKIREGDLYIAPDLAAEVLSPNAMALDLENRLIDYLDAGVRLVWTVNPKRRTVRVYRADDTTRLYRSADVIQSEPLLPGFRLLVGEIFPRD